MPASSPPQAANRNGHEHLRRFEKLHSRPLSSRRHSRTYRATPTALASLSGKARSELNKDLLEPLRLTIRRCRSHNELRRSGFAHPRIEHGWDGHHIEDVPCEDERAGSGLGEILESLDGLLSGDEDAGGVDVEVSIEGVYTQWL